MFTSTPMPSISIATAWPGRERVVVGRHEPGPRQQHGSLRDRVVAQDPAGELARRALHRAVDVSPAKCSSPSASAIRRRIERRVPVVGHGERRPDRAARRRRSSPAGCRAGSRPRCRGSRRRCRSSPRRARRPRWARPAPARAPSSSSRCGRGSSRPARRCGASPRPSGRARAVGVVDERVDVARFGLRLLEPPSRLRSYVTPAHQISGASIGASSSAGESVRSTPRRRRASAASGSSWSSSSTASSPIAADAWAAVGSARTKRAQYVARPPEMSKQAPVEKLISSLASQQISAATSAGSPRRPSGMRDGHVVDVLLRDLAEDRRVDHRRRDAVDEDAGARDVLADRLRERRSPRPSTRSTRLPSGCPPCRRSRRR